MSKGAAVFVIDVVVGTERKKGGAERLWPVAMVIKAVGVEKKEEERREEGGRIKNGKKKGEEGREEGRKSGKEMERMEAQGRSPWPPGHRN